jgi:diadenosine tetraphosphatase ApaH/serine/threonine PP2A family protein phosphatase
MQEDGTLFVHGSVRDPDEYIINRSVARENLDLLEKEYPDVWVCFFGHTHVKAVAPSPDGVSPGSQTLDLTSGGPYLVNPGSVGQPRDGDTFASYVIVEDAPDGGAQVTYRRVEYDVEKAQTKILNAGLPRILADRLAQGR